jgi:hypothetical protein
LAVRGLRPIAELAASRGHGDRLRYMAGCRCAECRQANSRYECARARARKAGDWNGVVSADRARAHIIALGRQGLGHRAIAWGSDVNEGTIWLIRQRKKLRIRARTERRILAVTKDAAADHAIIPAGPRVWKRIRQLLAEGYTKEQIAKQLGYARPYFQFGKQRVTVRNAFRVERLYHQLTT